MTITQALSLDVARESVVRISAKQFDSNSRYLLITVLESGQEQAIPSASTITLNGRRPDGSSQSFLGEVQDGKAYLKIDDYLLEQYGTVYCSVSIIGSDGAKLSTLSFRMVVERAESTGWVLMYTAPSALSAGTYHINVGSISYQFTLTQALPVGGCIYFASDYTGAKTVVNGADVETLTLTVGTGGTELIGSDVVNFLSQISQEVAEINEGLESKADKSAIEENLAAGTSLATIDKDSYTPNTSPYLHRISPSGKRCEYDVIGGTVGWNQYCNNYPTTTADGITLTNDGNGELTASGTSSAGRNHYFIYYSLNRPFYKDHKYLVTIGDLTSDNVASVILRNRTTSTNYASISIGASHNNYVLVNAADNGIMYYYLNYPYANTTITGTICPMVIDLTTLLGSTIADYAYTLEQATAGSGIAWLKSFGFLSKDYYEYCEPTLKSVEATARIATEADGTEHTYPLGDVTLRGIPKLDSSNNIYYDGDVYKADGSVKRRYAVVDMGTLNWSYDTTSLSVGCFRATINNAMNEKATDYFCPIYTMVGARTNLENANKTMARWNASTGAKQVAIRDDSYTDATTFKTAMSGVYLVYELATPTTETADQFTPIQYTGSTEEFSTDNDVPVGVDAKYYTDLTLPTLPTANGTYTLKCTVTDGTGIVSWVSE